LPTEKDFNRIKGKKEKKILSWSEEIRYQGKEWELKARQEVFDVAQLAADWA
jgi:hypothetical protein